MCASVCACVRVSKCVCVYARGKKEKEKRKIPFVTSKCTKAPSGLLKREPLCHHAISPIVNMPQYPADPVLIFVCMHGLK